MIAPSFSTLPIADAASAVAAMPAAPGAAQILGPQGQNLVIGKAADLRRWAASHLGLGKAPPPGVRPPIDLRPIASAISFARTTSQFQQRLAYERLMAQHVPLEKRRDLKPPGYLRLDLAQRFPRLDVVGDPALPDVFGPFRDRAAAQRALAALHKIVPLRPCDFVFEPDRELALGLACLYAQVHTCAAPCLTRVSEPEYGGLAGAVARLLANEASSADVQEWLPAWVGPLSSARAAIVEATSSGVEVYPVMAGTVLEERGRTTVPEAEDATLAELDWSRPHPTRNDLPWLSSWLHTPRRSGRYVRLPPG